MFQKNFVLFFFVDTGAVFFKKYNDFFILLESLIINFSRRIRYTFVSIHQIQKELIVVDSAVTLFNNNRFFWGNIQTLILIRAS